jgi:hypothetical protein
MMTLAMKNPSLHSPDGDLDDEEQNNVAHVIPRNPLKNQMKKGHLVIDFEN